MEFDAQGTEDIDLRIDDIFIQAEIRDAVHQHAAGPHFLFKDSRPVAHDAQVIGAGERGGAGADNRDLLIEVPVLLRDIAVALVDFPVCNKALDLIDSDRVVDASPRTLALTAPVADSSADGREGIFPLD